MFQTMVADLTRTAAGQRVDAGRADRCGGGDDAGRRAGKSAAATFLVDVDTHPQTLAVLATRAEPLGIELALFDPREKGPTPGRRPSVRCSVTRRRPERSGTRRRPWSGCTMPA